MLSIQSYISKNNQKKAYKIAVSIAFGLFGFCINFYPLHFFIPPHKASLVLGLVFPMLISLSWGWMYGLVALTLGMGGQTMWFLWVPINGWAPFIAIPVYNLWVLWHGWCKNKKSRFFANFYWAEIPFRIFNTIILYTIFRWVWQFNPSPWAPTATLTTAPVAFVSFIAIKQFAEGLIILLLADVLLSFQLFQKILLIEGKSHSKTGYLLSTFLLVGVICWFIAGFSDYFYSSEKLQYLLSHKNPSLAETLVLKVPGYELSIRALFILISLIAGLAVAKYVSKFRESELAKEEAYRIVNKSSSVAFLWKNTVGWPVEFATQNVQDLFGYSAGDFVTGKVSYTDIVHPEDTERVSGEVAFFSKKEGCHDFEHEPYRIVTKDNKVKWISDKTHIRRDDQGEITHYQGIVEDITLRKQIEEDLYLTKFAIDHSADSSFWSKPDGNFVYVSEAACRSLGYTNEELMAMTVSDFDPNFPADAWDDHWKKLKEKGFMLFETTHRSKEGRLFPVEVSANYMEYEGEEYNCSIVRDISYRKETEKKLLKVKKLESVGVLAGGIAHDFNNILSAIMGNINLALLDTNLKNDTKKLLSEAEKASIRAKGLTHQLLTFAKGGEPIKEAASLVSIIKDSANFVLQGDRVACDFNFPDQLWLVDIDKGQVSQVVQNIVLNASHAMSEGGVIKITSENVTFSDNSRPPALDEGKYVKLCIQDSGIGMPANVVEKIFDPYFSTKEKGSGLGLATSLSIINKHHGDIMVKSIPGIGTTFTIYLPATDKTEPEKQKPLVENKSFSKAKILVMDDDEMVRNVVQAMLTKLGHEVVLASDGKEAINSYQESINSDKCFDLVIMDLTIPGGMGGKEAAKEVLNLDKAAKIVVSSGYYNDPIMANYKDYGFCSAIGKPFNLSELSRVIGQIIN